MKQLKGLFVCVFLLCAIVASAAGVKNSQKLVDAAAKGKLKKVEKLLKKKNVDVNSRDENTGDTAFTVAVLNHHWDVANALSAAGADPYAGNYLAQNAFMKAIWLDDREAAINLLEAGMSPDVVSASTGRSILFDMVSLEEGTERVKFLLEHGANPNLQDQYGDTPLHEALAVSRYTKARTEKVKLLVEHGAKLDIYNNNGISPLGAAAMSAALEKPKCVISYPHPECEPLEYDPKAAPTEKDKLVEYLKSKKAPALTEKEKKAVEKEANRPEILK